MLLTTLALAAALFGPSEVAFRIPDPDFIPEGIAYDEATNRFFVGSTFKRKIVSVDRGGQVRDFTAEGQDGLFGVLGLRVDAKRRTLWAVSSNAGGTMPARALDKTCLGCSTVTSYNVDTGRLLKKYELPNKPSVHFLNDLVVAGNGDVYVTDTISGDVYRIQEGKDGLEPFVSLGKDAYPNGIDVGPDGRTIFVATNVGIRRIEVSTGTVTNIGGLGEKVPSIDGLCYFDGSLVAIQPFEQDRRVMRYFLEGDRITKSEVLEADHPLFKQPTTGVIVDKSIYYIANAQLQFFRGMYKDGAYDRAALADVVVMKLPLTAR